MRNILYRFNRLWMALCICLLWQGAFGQHLAALRRSKTLLNNELQVGKTLKQTLTELESKYHVFFIYESQLVEEKIISGDNQTAQKVDKLDALLKTLLQPLDLKYEKIKDNVYVIVLSDHNKRSLKEIKKELTISLDLGIETAHADLDKVMLSRLDYIVTAIQAADVTIVGTVKSETGEPMPGVSVVVKGTNTGTQTDVEGKYRLSVREGATLVFSFVGYLTVEQAIGNRTALDIQLQPDIKTLQQVVVVGYGTQEKKDVTGSIATVDAKQIQSLPLVSTEQALQGRTPGVLVTTNGGQPGGGINVMVRGVGTTGNSSPIYVIDGVITGSGGTDNLGTSPLSLINPNDIESMTVLKDASSAAIYGASAANGVVLITTKRGKAGKTRVSLDAYYGVQKAWRQLDLLDASQQAEAAKASFFNSGKTYTQIPANLRFPSLIKNNVDWQDEIYRTAPIQSYNLSVSGGSEVATFSLSGNWFKQEGTLLNTSFERRSIRANSDFKIGKRIRLGESMTLSNTVSNRQINGGGRRSFEHVIKQSPGVAVYNPNKKGGFNTPSSLDGHDTDNPVLTNTLYQDRPTNYRVLGNIYGELDLISGLTYRLFTGIDYNPSEGYTYNPSYEGLGGVANSALGITRGVGFNTQVTNTLTYNKRVNKHQIEVLAGFERRYNSYSNLSGTATILPNDQVLSLAGAQTKSVTNSKTESALESLFGRVNYSFADKYLVTFNLRRDGSSKLAKENRYQVFPSFSLGWRLSEEGFLKTLPWISDLKLRGGYGELGNVNALGDYPFVVNLNGAANYNFDGSLSAGVTPGELSNPAIRWETSKSSTVGVDAGLFDNTILFTAEYYVRKTEGLQARDSRIAPSVGLSAPIINIGTVENRGWDFSATYRKSQGDFSYDFTANLSTITNKLTALGDSGNAYVAVSYNTLQNITRTVVGQSLGSYYGFEADGFFQTQEQLNAVKQTGAQIGDRRIKDLNNDKVIDDKDRTAIGSPIPKFYYGFTANVSYKQFDLSVFLQGVQGNKIFNALKFWLENDNTNSNKGAAFLDRWTPFNLDATVGRASNEQMWDMATITDRYVEDGSFLRMKNVTLGYSFKPAILSKLGNLSKLRAYVTAQNLLTFTKYSGYDPEIGELGDNDPNRAALTRGVDIGSYPQPRTFILGVQIGF